MQTNVYMKIPCEYKYFYNFLVKLTKMNISKSIKIIHVPRFTSQENIFIINDVWNGNEI